jgi:hypothetical protein
MATAHSTVKAGSGRNPPLKTGTPRAANRAKAPAQRRKARSAPTPPAQGPITRTPGSEVASRGVRIRMQGRLQEMIRAELGNLGRLEVSPQGNTSSRSRSGVPDARRSGTGCFAGTT